MSVQERIERGCRLTGWLTGSRLSGLSGTEQLAVYYNMNIKCMKTKQKKPIRAKVSIAFTTSLTKITHMKQSGEPLTVSQCSRPGSSMYYINGYYQPTR